MYQPKDMIQATESHEIIALIGAPGTGKTTSCLTFPNPIFLDCDHKLPKGVSSIPFWDADWTLKADGGKETIRGYPNHRDAAKTWMRTNLPQFTPEQTVILDSWTSFMYLFAMQTRVEDSLLPKANQFFFWKTLACYCEEIVAIIKKAKCRVVVTIHETPERDEEGGLTGKLKPVMDGSFKDKLLGSFTDVWRQIHDPIKVDKDGRRVRDPQTNAPAIERGWFWQLIGDHLIDCNMNPTLGAKVRALGISRVPADYKVIQAIYSDQYKP